ncbi:GH92 family glycosyl hydrolase [Phycicoccus sp. CSK15P-2]|uniref:GH92 family glycosyl hydrolase n=1 Tax=Phycicoccus sp. CSK15P-2 TaxID=2807627 RepID=UPI00194EA47A|nr:GH92 family glycosyl hydrolase [Phycicoccus sp. CSK15P-2]MBM6403416.1 GH92 family glycosyl hydrolase [Phycicoccus sp. CSK15P-2]
MSSVLPSRRALTALLATSLTAALLGIAPVTPADAASRLSPFDAVDQFIGTELDTSENKSNDAYGNTFPGAALPFGMVQPSPTTYKTDEPNGLVREKGGYEYTADQIRGFGLTRYSGSGCHLRFGGYDIPTIPYSGELVDGTLPVSPDTDVRRYFLDFDHDDEVAEPGYYAVRTVDGTKTELTATTRSAVSRFDFEDNATLIVDASGPNNRTFGTHVDIDPRTRTVSGWTHVADMCDNGNSYRLHFSTTYDKPFTSYGTWNGGTMTRGSRSVEKVAEDTSVDYRHDTGAWLTFADGARVTARTGVSFVSVRNAAVNRVVESQLRSFDGVRWAARKHWEQALGTVDATGGSAEDRTELYTAVYHSLLHPNIRDDVNREYLGYDGKVHQAAWGRHFYMNFAGSGWDMYRSQAQLIALLYPEVAADVLQSMVLLHEQTGGWQPGAARMQGDNLPVIIATLDDMGIRDYDRKAALKGMVEAQQLPATKSDRSDALQYFSTGFVENRKGDFATSRVLEYATDDFAIAQLAGSLGEDATHDRFMERAQSWLQVFDPTTRHIRPRSRNGFDRGFDLRGRDGTGGGQFNQSTGYQYGWNVPQNMAELIERRGGAEAAEDQLDTLMEELDAGAYTKTGNYLSNEPAFMTPWVYHWLGAPEKTADILARADVELFDTTPAGLPGNDDQGALSAWYVFSRIGMFPAVYGTGDMLLTAPAFEQVEIDPVGSRRTIRVSAPKVSDERRYATGLRVNGRRQSASWVDADFVRRGGRLDFTVSGTPGRWGTGAQDLPPSYGEGVDARNNVGTTPDGVPMMGSLDMSDWSLSRESLAAAGAGPGDTLEFQAGLTFTWPDVDPGRPDNWVPHGQRLDVEDQKAASLSFLGLATNGPSTGDAVVEYTDGTTQRVPVSLADWGADGRAQANTALVEVKGRNNANGSSGGGTFRVFATRPAALDATRTVDAVVLPQASYDGVMHVVDLALSAEEWEDPDAPKGTPERVVLTLPEDASTGQYVTWRTRSVRTPDGVVEVRSAGGGAVRVVDAEEQTERTVGGYPARSHSALIDGLTPGTTYEYRVGSAAAWSDWHSFTTATAGEDPFTFLYFGDAQEGIDDSWRETVRRAREAEPDADLSLFAGDLINTATAEKEWNDWFDVLTDVGAATEHNAVAAMGNHEIGGDPLAPVYRDSFEYAANGPEASDAGEYEATFGAHLAGVMKDSVYFTDHQGVRFVTMNANRDDICTIAKPAGMTDYDCGTARTAWMTMQASWLDRVLADNPNRWAVMLTHQPIFSTGVTGGGLRDEDDWRRHIGPVLERRNIDLVLQGHDHTYGRGHMNRNETATPGLTTGPVYVNADGGSKMYQLSPEDDNVWTRNNAEAVRRAQDTSTYQAIHVDGDTLRYESVVTYVRPGGEAYTEVGDVLDSFTVTKYDDGAKWVAEAGVEVPGDEVASQVRPQPTLGLADTFDPATFAPVARDDDFSADPLGGYEVVAGGGEALPEVGVDTGKGVLTATASTRSWANLRLPEEAGDRWALVVEPTSFAGTGAAEDSLFLGSGLDGSHQVLHWYNHTRGEAGFDFANGSGKTVGRGNQRLTWQAGDRLALVAEYGEVSSWVEHDGTWRRVNLALLAYGVDEADLASWHPTVGLRLDPGSITLDRVTLLAGE